VDAAAAENMQGMTELDELEQIAQQTAFNGQRSQGRGAKVGRMSMGDNLLRASISVARPKAARTREPVESVVSPPTISTCIARPVTGYKGLVETCRQRATELALSRLEIDRLAGLPAGYSAKLLGKDDGVPRKKRMWPASLEAILGTLGLQIIIIEDHAATSKTLSRRVPVDDSNQRFDNKCNSKTMPKLAAPQDETLPVSRAHLRVVQSKRRGSKYG
jgi:hypothetical protein